MPAKFSSFALNIAVFLLFIALFGCTRSEDPGAGSPVDTKIIDFGKEQDQTHLISGWDTTEWMGGKTAVWSKSGSSELEFFSRNVEAKMISMRCMPIHFPGIPPQIIQISANDHPLTELQLGRDWRDYYFVIPKEVIKQGENKIIFRYGYGQTIKTRISDSTHPPIAFDFMKIDPLIETTVVDFGNPKFQPHLVDGWYKDEASKKLTFVWSKGESSRIRFDVAELSDKEMKIRCMTLPAEKEPAQIVSLIVNGKPAGELEISGPWKEYTKILSTSHLKIGHNTLDFKYSNPRLSGTGDIRILSIAVDYIKFANLPTGKNSANASQQDDHAAAVIPRPLKQPNIIVYVLDALRADHLGIYGYNRNTSPEIDRIASAGIVFENAFAQAPFTLASASSYLTSTYPIFIKGGQSLHEDSTTIAEVMKENGYQTAAISANIFISKSYGTLQGFDRVREIPVHPRMNDSTRQVTNLLPSVLDELNGLDRPFFMYIHSFNPHSPYKVPEPYWSTFRNRELKPVRSSNEFLFEILYGKTKITNPEKEDMVAQYDGGILFSDSEIGKTIEILKERNLAESTLLILMADHGEEFLEHGGVLHGGQLFEELIRVPLILWYPGFFKNPMRISGQVELIDVMPTILDIASAQTPHDLRMQGSSLLRQLYSDQKQPSERSTYSYEPDLGALSIRTNHQKYIHAPGGLGIGAAKKSATSYLFDLKADPAELKNKADVMPVIANKYREEALLWLALQKEKLKEFGPASKTGPELDAAAKERLKALGYIQ